MTEKIPKGNWRRPRTIFRTARARAMLQAHPRPVQRPQQIRKPAIPKMLERAPMLNRIAPAMKGCLGKNSDAYPAKARRRIPANMEREDPKASKKTMIIIPNGLMAPLDSEEVVPS